MWHLLTFWRYIESQGAEVVECACVIGLPEVKVSNTSSYLVKKLPLACLYFRKDMA